MQGNDSSQFIPQLRCILSEPRLYQRLVHFKDSNAQTLLDLLQLLLDVPELDTQLRRSLIAATQRLSRKSGRYPICYELKGVKQVETEPVTAGGFADIYRAEFKGKVVCLKVARLYQDSQLEYLLKQFSKEVILWGQLSHPNVLPMYGVYRFKNKLCLVAPWMENGDIGIYLKKNPKANRHSLCADIVQGLQYLHKESIVHGDLKGANILIHETGKACLSDFGISGVLDSNIVAWTSQSSVASKGGSVRWQAPELFDMEKDEEVKNSPYSDMYALGCVFYEVSCS
ncbi:L-type lectin-domain containing receptor kinase I.3 [Termitomyces sp. J132]|nr:L-type lectin-domain containing receptor kinase I.3 [Termitomyces sp. J132]